MSLSVTNLHRPLDGVSRGRAVLHRLVLQGYADHAHVPGRLLAGTDGQPAGIAPLSGLADGPDRRRPGVRGLPGRRARSLAGSEAERRYRTRTGAAGAVPYTLAPSPPGCDPAFGGAGRFPIIAVLTPKR